MSVPIQQINPSPKQLCRRKGSKGFTLIELLVVVAIIGALAAIAIPVYNSYINSAKRTLAYGTLDTIRKTLELYHIDYQQYPTAINLQPERTIWAKLFFRAYFWIRSTMTSPQLSVTLQDPAPIP